MSDSRNTLTCLLDEIIPPSGDGRLPGAGELGLAEQLDSGPLARGLALVEELAHGRGAGSFSELAQADRIEIMQEAATREPDFLPGLTAQAYMGYYQSPRVLEAIGLEARPPYPKGYAVAPTDFSILDPVRRRPPLYRGSA